MLVKNNLTLLPIWHPNQESIIPPPNPNMANWLNTQILSQALKKRVPHISLALIQQGIAQPHSDEATKLELAEAEPFPFVRQVTIGSPNCRYLYCRVVVPPKLYYQEQTTFDTLGSRFIGETLLYNQPNVHRSKFEYALLNTDHTLYQEAALYTQINSTSINPKLYARRSLFYLPVLPLLITEVFVHVVSLS
jgi:chorismate--pyruvate lyase